MIGYGLVTGCLNIGFKNTPKFRLQNKMKVPQLQICTHRWQSQAFCGEFHQLGTIGTRNFWRVLAEKFQLAAVRGVNCYLGLGPNKSCGTTFGVMNIHFFLFAMFMFI